jgi:exopolysaccharide production protein ExoZ
MATANKKIESVQLLRALAAVGVVLFHTAGQLAVRNGFVAVWAGLGAAGVDLFFIVSGFIMWVTAIDRDESVQRFATKRILRIVPLYWLTTAIVLAIVLVAPALMRNASPDPIHYLASFGFVAWRHPRLPGHFWPAVVPGWTLNYEMLFYFFVAASLAMARAWRAVFIGGALFALTLLGLLVHSSGVLSFYTNPIILEFLFGVVIGMTFQPTQQNKGAHYALCLIGLALFISVGTLEVEQSRVFTWGLPLAIFAFGAINISLPSRNRVVHGLRVIGDASYSIYLTQFIALPPVAMLMAHVLPHMNMILGSLTFALGVVAACVVIGVGTYYFIEKPLLRASTELLARKHRSDRHSTVPEW